MRRALVLLVLSSAPSLAQDPAAELDIQVLIRGLGASSLEDRDRATQELIRLGLKARPALLKAAEGDDAETAGRARGILDAIDKQLPSLIDVLDRRLKGDSGSYHRLVRDLGETVRSRCLGRDWADVSAVLKNAGIAIPRERERQHDTLWEVPFRKGVLGFGKRLDFDLVLEFTTQRYPSRTHATTQLIHEAKALFVARPKAPVEELIAEGKFPKDSLLEQFFKGKSLPAAAATYPVMDELTVTYERSWHHRSTIVSIGFRILCRLEAADGLSGQSGGFHARSRLDPSEDLSGESLEPGFESKDEIEEVVGGFSGSWQNTGSGPNRDHWILKRLPRPPSPPETAAAHAFGLGDLKTLPPTTRELFLHGDQFEDGDLQELHRLKNLRHLSLSDVQKLSSVALSHLADVKSLVRVDLCNASESDLLEISKIEGLATLRLYSLAWTFSERGWDALARLKNLSAIILWSDSITDGALEKLAGLSGLEEVHIWTRNLITDGGLAHLSKLAKLRKLSLGRADVSARGLESLVGLKNLEYLSFSYSSVDDAGLRVIGRMRSLRRVVLCGLDGISGEGLLALKELPDLDELWLQTCKRITQADVDKLLSALPAKYEVK